MDEAQRKRPSKHHDRVTIGYSMEPMSASFLSRVRDVQTRVLEDGAVLVNLATGACFELNRVGAQVWELLLPGSTESAICEALAERYSVTREVLAADVRRLLIELLQNRLLESSAPSR